MRFVYLLFFISTELFLCISEGRFSAWADGDNEQDSALEAVERGEALSLSEVLMRVRTRVGGEIVGISLQREDHRLVYVIKFIVLDAEIRSIRVDAKSGEPVNDETH
jgi:uncharacterized membrane protein YkoI